MKKISKISCLLIGLFILFSTNSCEKLSDEELLTDHIWKWNTMTTNATDPDILSLVTLVNALMTGGTMEFRADGTYTVTILNNPDNGTWEMPDNETFILDGDEMTLVKLTKDELVLEGVEVDDELGAYTVKMHWKK